MIQTDETEANAHQMNQLQYFVQFVINRYCSDH